jgi:cytochrome subunit of sulfide dehydrogenase
MRDDVLALLAALVLTGASCSGAAAQSFPPPGAVACAGCHAGRDNAMPSLDGKSASDIEAAMAAFRSGSREATVMDRIAKGFSEAETAAISAWIATNGASK